MMIARFLTTGFKQVVMLSDLLIPTSGEVLEKPLRTEQPITYELMSSQENNMKMNRIST